ncbi:asparagine synthase (glutamine-hydrolyzing) [Paucibacter sp. DJ1R-11]|uniref:asparagine synthase (glutamine-hydrolyzing) n=1 Tax=Paucibacter sp. DJ1R-11 TaxID=2893556 RepID=UPI0021E3A8AE|nr:asparagine synthase (glutamine-hydrolyzing) [Paucibacter sp. DJ1R-11]MCV2364672.1 asparagine synthase (glutamine-hydrolyzing) [Paucibacter sp. DJ1R-11]
MCGLVALFSPSAQVPLSALLAMTRQLRHRGPDGEGFMIDSGEGLRLLAGAETPAAVLQEASESRPSGRIEAAPAQRLRIGLGHRRLSIVDLSPQGHQPMRRGHLVTVFNGEIYDHVEQRRVLEGLGHRFQSDSDTEVLLAAYAQWGEQAFSRLNGMWACVILDLSQRRLLIARDRYGVKPLYWWQGSDGELALASEIKALLAHPQIAARPAEGACGRWLQAGPESWRRETLFAGIQSFPAGHWAELKLDQPGRLQPKPWWDGPQVDAEALLRPFNAQEGDRLAEEYRSLMQDAVRVRMRMDVRFGTALSGGLDSSQIAMLVNEDLQRRGIVKQQEVFSSVYASGSDGVGMSAGYQEHLRKADESSFIDSVARRLGVHSNLIQPRWQDIPVEHERMIWALDVPPINTLMSSWHTYALVAQRGVVVTLDGQGADEQLAGYVYYASNLLVQSGTREALAHARALHRTIPGIGSLLLTGLAGHAGRRVLGAGGLQAVLKKLGRGQSLGENLDQALHRDFSTHLQTLLFYADKSAMAWSVESRMPFMDWRLVNFLAQLPLAYRIHGGWTKWLARHAMQGRLPDEVLWRRDKLGWAIPEAAWFGSGGPLAGWLSEQLAGSALVAELADSQGLDLATAPLATRLRLLNLAVWSRLYFEEPGRPGRALGRGRALGAA